MARNKLRIAMQKEKHPGTATLLSFLFVVGGQIYNGHYIKAVFLIISIGIGGIIAANSDGWVVSTREQSLLFIAGVTVMVVLYLMSILDASRSAHSINHQRQVAKENLQRIRYEWLGQPGKTPDKDDETTITPYWR